MANDDQYGCDKVTLDFYEKLHAAGVPVEAIFLPQGKHAFNMGDRSKLVTVQHLAATHGGLDERHGLPDTGCGIDSVDLTVRDV